MATDHKEWEYRILLLFCKDEPTAIVAAAALNKAGADGWELVSVTENQRGVHSAFLKRLR